MRFPKLSVVLLAALGFACSSSGEEGNGNPGAGGNGAGGLNAGGLNAGGLNAGGLGPLGGPGRVTLRRLNRREYDNTIRDLVFLDLKPAVTNEFPPEEMGDGFDNDGDVLVTNTLAAEKYLGAAQAVVKAAFADPTAKAKLITCAVETDAACAGTTVAEFARRAFRRPVAADEMAPYMTLVDLAKTKGDNTETGVGLAFAAVLTSPDFLFMVEPDATPSVIRPLTAFEVATRLSYFIWSTMPDETLYQAALAGKLSQPADVVAQVQRMLADAKAVAFTDVMTSQWMQGMVLKTSEPDTTIFPSWKPTLRTAMEQELRLFMEGIVKGTAPATDLLTANYTYANQELAQFYGLPNAGSLTEQFARVDVDLTRRGGVMRQGGFLVLTSHRDRTAPTLRGKWILSRLLCDPPPPPPGIIPALETEAPFEGTLRDRLEKLHETKGATCAGCHAVIDPMGFALENYDAIGQWRDMDGKYPVNATGTMPGTGVTFTGAADVTKIIVEDPRFSKCVAKKLMTFATGRKMNDADVPTLEDLGTKFKAGGSKLPQLAEWVATSVPMTSRQTEAL
jgi:hypothetical protein